MGRGFDRLDSNRGHGSLGQGLSHLVKYCDRACLGCDRDRPGATPALAVTSATHLLTTGSLRHDWGCIAASATETLCHGPRGGIILCREQGHPALHRQQGRPASQAAPRRM